MKSIREAKDCTAQDVFDSVVAYAASMKEPATIQSIGDTSKCVYRKTDIDGNVVNACFIEHFLNDDYKSEMEGSGFYGYITFKYPELSSPHNMLLSDLQSVHDDEPFNEWKNSLIRVAQSHNLEYDLVIELFEIKG